MLNDIITVTNNLPSKLDVYRAFILHVKDRMSDLPDAKFNRDCAPLVHKFCNGLYIRQITMPKGWLFVSKIHKRQHPYFVLTGDVSVFTPEGITRIKAPYSGITEPGTIRILYTHEETIWTTVHTNPTNETDLDKVEAEHVTTDFNELLPGYNEILERVNKEVLL